MPIVTVATAVDLENGSTLLLIFGQVLWFRDIMENSLIKPNQYRHCGIPVFDDTIDKYHELGLAVDDNLFIPMDMDGTTCSFEACFPYMEEMESCKRII